MASTQGATSAGVGKVRVAGVSRSGIGQRDAELALDLGQGASVGGDGGDAVGHRLGELARGGVPVERGQQGQAGDSPVVARVGRCAPSARRSPGRRCRSRCSPGSPRSPWRRRSGGGCRAEPGPARRRSSRRHRRHCRPKGRRTSRTGARGLRRSPVRHRPTSARSSTAGRGPRHSNRPRTARGPGRRRRVRRRGGRRSSGRGARRPWRRPSTGPGRGSRGPRRSSPRRPRRRLCFAPSPRRSRWGRPRWPRRPGPLGGRPAPGLGRGRGARGRPGRVRV